MSKIKLEGYIMVQENDMAAVLEELPNHIRLTHQEKGCLVFKVVQDTAESNRFNVFEEFRSKEDFNKHQERVKASKWGEVTVNVERCYSVTET